VPGTADWHVPAERTGGMDELTREFLIESQEGLDRMERCLTDLENRPDDTSLLADIFRSVHTIKGTTGFLGFTRLEKLAHAGENLMSQVREGTVAVNAEIITGLLQLLDGLRSILKIIERDGNEGQDADQDLIVRLNELQSSTELREPVEAKAAAAVECASSAAPPATSENGPREGEDRPAERPTAPRADGPRADARPAQSAAPAAESTLRVDIALLNRMMNLVGELVLTRNQVLQATGSDPRMTMLSRRLDMVTADLREAVMKARMQPVSNIFSKMPRMVRDLCRSLGRQVRLEMEGQDTELDKSLLEAIKDPLTHAIRNALDHGIEAPETRAAAGKDPEGLLRLRAAQEGSHVIVEVCDDGAGIAVDRVRAKAIERGLITEERAAQQSERELLQLIFVPGFSTAAAVTNVSGRGVGMDVVRTNVERIGGKVELESRPGKGTTLRLRIPLTLAIIPALIVRSLEQSFALPQGALSELVHVAPGQNAIEWIEDAPLYRLRGRLLPLVFLDALLMPGAGPRHGSDRDRFIAVLDADGRHFGLVVDGLADPEEIVVKPLSAVLKEIGVYAGATVLGNAELALILDLGAIAQRSGIGMTGEDEAVESEAHTGNESGSEFLVVEKAGRQEGIPLDRVIRIEQLTAKRIEYIGSRTVLNFEGQLVGVEDDGGILASSPNPDDPIIVVICREGDHHVGVAVSHVLDVAAGGALYEAGSSRISEGVTLLKERVTKVVELENVVLTQALPEAHNTMVEALA
jgi:two-component system chemotaxis sensor kinase CheA